MHHNQAGLCLRPHILFLRIFQDSFASVFNLVSSFFFLIYYQVISLWIMDQPYLGNKAPRPGRERLFWCPACWTANGPAATLSSRHIFILELLDNVQCRHVLESCSAVRMTREALGIQAFLDDCLHAGRSRASSYKFYILGLDKNGDKIDLALYLKRGACLQELTDAWLATWEDPVNDV